MNTNNPDTNPDNQWSRQRSLENLVRHFITVYVFVRSIDPNSSESIQKKLFYMGRFPRQIKRDGSTGGTCPCRIPKCFLFTGLCSKSQKCYGNPERGKFARGDSKRRKGVVSENFSEKKVFSENHKGSFTSSVGVKTLTLSFLQRFDDKKCCHICLPTGVLFTRLKKTCSCRTGF